MDQYHRAAQLWSVLVFAARDQKILSYGTARHLTGLASAAIGPIGLGPILWYCIEEDLPWLTGLVVKESTGLPGKGFMDSAKKKYGPAVNISQLQARVFVHEWFKHPAPTPDDLRVAEEKHPPTEVEPSRNGRR